MKKLHFAKLLQSVTTLLGQVLADHSKEMLGLGVVGLDGLLGGNDLLDVTVQEVQGKLGVGRVLITHTDPQEVRNDGNNVVPVDDQEEVDDEEGLQDGQVVEDVRAVGLDLVQCLSDGGGDSYAQSGSEVRDGLDDLEDSRDDENEQSGPHPRVAEPENEYKSEQLEAFRFKEADVNVGCVGIFEERVGQVNRVCQTEENERQMIGPRLIFDLSISDGNEGEADGQEVGGYHAWDKEFLQIVFLADHRVVARSVGGSSARLGWLGF